MGDRSGISQPTFRCVMPDVLGGIVGLSHWYIRFSFLVGEQANQEVQLSHVIR